MDAFDALSGPEAVVDRTPGREKRRQRAHVVGRRAAVAEARGDARQTGLVDHAFCANGFQLFRDRVKRLIPGDRRKPRILLHPLFRIGPLHRGEDAIGIVGLLHEAIGLHAGPSARGMDAVAVEIGTDLGRDPILDLHAQEVGAGHAIVAEGRDALCGRHGAGRLVGCAHHFLRRFASARMSPSCTRDIMIQIDGHKSNDRYRKVDKRTICVRSLLCAANEPRPALSIAHNTRL